MAETEFCYPQWLSRDKGSVSAYESEIDKHIMRAYWAPSRIQLAIAFLFVCLFVCLFFVPVFLLLLLSCWDTWHLVHFYSRIPVLQTLGPNPTS